MRVQGKHLAREFRTMKAMVRLYCRDKHGSSADTDCRDCSAFLEYAQARLQKCPYGEDKPTCSNCPVHCYKPAMRDRAREIMRYSGPKMLLRHPYLAITHILDGRRRVEHPLSWARERRLRPPEE